MRILASDPQKQGGQLRRVARPLGFCMHQWGWDPAPSPARSPSGCPRALVQTAQPPPGSALPPCSRSAGRFPGLCEGEAPARGEAGSGILSQGLWRAGEVGTWVSPRPGGNNSCCSAWQQPHILGSLGDWHVCLSFLVCPRWVDMGTRIQ